MYLTLEEYKTMGGMLEGTTFNNYLFHAEMYVNRYTFNRLTKDTDIPTQVKRCVFEIINLLDIKNQVMMKSAGTVDGTGIIASQSNDGVSVKYNVLSASSILSSSDTEIKNLCRLYLSGIKNSEGKIVSYRGLYKDE